MLKSNLLATKLHRPSLPTQWVQRPYLTQRLHEGLALQRPFTLVSAPAGFGKTTCICAWLNELDSWPVAWLSLDPVDDDPGRFFTYFIAALQTVSPDLGQEIMGVLHAGQIPPAEVLTATLINDILAWGKPILLVLDDFHLIQDAFIFQVLEQFIINLPSTVHLVLITREDPPLPLARLRANNRLTEIRAQDLRFAAHDIAAFLNEERELALSQTDIAALADKTEGWIVGLQLAAIALQSLPDGDTSGSSRFIANLSGSHRFVLSYLTEQVLDQQPDEIRQFLLQTSILNKLNGGLCNAVTGRTDGRFLLEHLINANLFLIPLDDAGQWYRYHHLFADLLRERLQAYEKGETAVLHQRASQWYAQENMVSEAIQHALAAADYVLAVELLESHAMKLIMQGYVKTVNGWIDAVPEQWQSQSPQTNLALAWMYLLRGTYAQARPCLERLHATLDDFPPDDQLSEAEMALKADWLVLQALMLYMEGKMTGSAALAEQALAIVPEQDSRVRSLAYYALASVYWVQEDYVRAADVFQTAIQYGRLADNLVAEMLSTLSLAMIAFEHGQLHLAFEIAAPVIERVEQTGSLHPMAAGVYSVLGDVCYQWNQLAEARQHNQRALQLSRLGGTNTTTIFVHVSLSRLAQLEGDLDEAAREIQTAVSLLPPERPDYIAQEVVAQQVSLALARNRPEAAEMALQRHGFSFQDTFTFPDFPADRNISHSLGIVYNSSLRVLLDKVQRDSDLANVKVGMTVADMLVTAALESQQILVALEALLLRAKMHTVLNNSKSNVTASQTDYLRALELAEPEGFITIFVEKGSYVAEAFANFVRQNQLGSEIRPYVQRILTAFPDFQLPTTEKSAPLIEPLTERELDVLHLMADGLKYQEIAEQLVISVNTVRYHIKALYGKFNVNNRTQAIEAARQHGIL